jgi:hypothetical protein
MAKRCYKLLLWKAYFDKGFGLTNYLKYALLVFGWATNSVEQTIIIGIVWCIGCLILGKLWFKYKIVEVENEVQNHVNPFMREMRTALKIKTFK